MNRNLEGVKVGDVIKVNDTFGRSFNLHTVARVTATRAVCERESFMIDSGLQVGTRSTGRWSSSKHGYLVKPDEVEALKKAVELKRRVVNAQARVQRIEVTADNIDAAEAFLLASMPKEKERS